MALPAGRKGVRSDLVKPDGSLNVNTDPYELPTASANVKGGVKIGEGLSMEGEVLKVASSGGHLYRHTIRYYSMEKYCIYFDLYSDTFSTVVSGSDLQTLLNTINDKWIPASGKATSGSTVYDVAAVKKSSGDNGIVITACASGSALNTTLTTSGGTYTDETCVQIL